MNPRRCLTQDSEGTTHISKNNPLKLFKTISLMSSTITRIVSTLYIKGTSSNHRKGKCNCEPTRILFAYKLYSYIIHDLLGKGTFGQVVYCKREGSKEEFALKIVKSEPAYTKAALKEIHYLLQVN